MVSEPCVGERNGAVPKPLNAKIDEFLIATQYDHVVLFYAAETEKDRS